MWNNYVAHGMENTAIIDSTLDLIVNVSIYKLCKFHELGWPRNKDIADCWSLPLDATAIFCSW